MTCSEIERDDIIERYVAGALTDSQRDELEEHYFGCEDCFQKLQTCRLARSGVRRDEQAIRAARGPVRVFPRRLWPVVALAAAGFVAFIVLDHGPEPPVTRPTAPPARPDPLIAMARFDPPPYKASAMRDAGSAAQSSFNAAMENYTRGRYDQAIPGLRAASEQDPRNTAYRFFLGVTSLLAGQTDAGIAALGAVIQEGDTPFLNEAWFYRAKGYLARRDVTAARADLEHVVSLNGDLAPEAQALLNQLAQRK